MSANTTFDITIRGEDARTKTIAAFVIERALERDGFVNVQNVDARENKKPSLYALMREIEPQLLQKLVVIQEVTTVPSNRFYNVSENDSTLYDDSGTELDLRLLDPDLVTE